MLMLRDGRPIVIENSIYDGHDPLSSWARAAGLQVRDIVYDCSERLVGYPAALRFDTGVALFQAMAVEPAAGGGTEVWLTRFTCPHSVEYRFRGWLADATSVATADGWVWELRELRVDGTILPPGGEFPATLLNSSTPPPASELPPSRRILAELATMLGWSVPHLLQQLQWAASSWPGAPTVRGTAVLPDGCSLECDELPDQPGVVRISLRLVVRGPHVPLACRFTATLQAGFTTVWRLASVMDAAAAAALPCRAVETTRLPHVPTRQIDLE